MREADAPRYTWGAYLADRWPAAALAAACAVAVGAAALVLGVSRDGAILCACIIVACAATALLIGYGRRCRFWKRAAELADAIDDPAQFTALLDDPAFLEGRIAYAMAERLVDLGNSQLTDARMAAGDYREYVELWIHEAKTPVAAAKLIVSRMHGAEADALALEIERVESQVEQALYYARTTSLANDYSIREVALAEAAREACKRHARFLIERQAIPQVDIPDGARVLADPPWLIFMLGQIIVNAAQYGASRITFTCAEEGAGTSRERTLLQIADDGAGIAPEDVPRVFDRGFTGGNGRRSGTATGMGLHLVAAMCARLGLGVELASEQGAGTRVTLIFPHDRRRLDT